MFGYRYLVYIRGGQNLQETAQELLTESIKGEQNLQVIAQELLTEYIGRAKSVGDSSRAVDRTYKGRSKSVGDSSRAVDTFSGTKLTITSLRQTQLIHRLNSVIQLFLIPFVQILLSSDLSSSQLKNKIIITFDLGDID